MGETQYQGEIAEFVRTAPGIGVLMRQSALNAVYELAKRDPRVVFIGSD